MQSRSTVPSGLSCPAVPTDPASVCTLAEAAGLEEKRAAGERLAEDLAEEFAKELQLEEEEEEKKKREAQQLRDLEEEEKRLDEELRQALQMETDAEKQLNELNLLQDTYAKMITTLKASDETLNPLSILINEEISKVVHDLHPKLEVTIKMAVDDVLNSFEAQTKQIEAAIVDIINTLKPMVENIVDDAAPVIEESLRLGFQVNTYDKKEIQDLVKACFESALPQLEQKWKAALLDNDAKINEISQKWKAALLDNDAKINEISSRTHKAIESNHLPLHERLEKISEQANMLEEAIREALGAIQEPALPHLEQKWKAALLDNDAKINEISSRTQKAIESNHLPLHERLEKISEQANMLEEAIREALGAIQLMKGGQL